MFYLLETRRHTLAYTYTNYMIYAINEESYKKDIGVIQYEIMNLCDSTNTDISKVKLFDKIDELAKSESKICYKSHDEGQIYSLKYNAIKNNVKDFNEASYKLVKLGEGVSVIRDVKYVVSKNILNLLEDCKIKIKHISDIGKNDLKIAEYEKGNIDPCYLIFRSEDDLFYKVDVNGITYIVNDKVTASCDWHVPLQSFYNINHLAHYSKYKEQFVFDQHNYRVKGGKDIYRGEFNKKHIDINGNNLLSVDAYHDIFSTRVSVQPDEFHKHFELV